MRLLVLWGGEGPGDDVAWWARRTRDRLAARGDVRHATLVTVHGAPGPSGTELEGGLELEGAGAEDALEELVSELLLDLRLLGCHAVLAVPEAADA